MSYNSASYPIVTDFNSVLAKSIFNIMYAVVPNRTEPLDIMIFTKTGGDDLTVRVDVDNKDELIYLCSDLQQLNKVFQYAQFWLSSYTFALTLKETYINGISFEGKI